jgi:hypothetical protein
VPIRNEESSPVTSLDDVEHIRGLHWAEQARHMRAMHHALQSIEAAQDGAKQDMSSATMALRFFEEERMACGNHAAESQRCALQVMEMEEAEEEIAAEAELQESLQAFTSALLAKSRACVFQPMRA